MCIIIACPKGTSKNSDFLIEAIKTSSLTNDDGMGFSFKRNTTKKVYISKGYTKVDDFINAIMKRKLSENDELLIHLRIGNKGAINTDMCHPFVCSTEKEEILLNHKYVDKPVYVHNGTMYSYSHMGSEYSDTYNFAQEILGYDFIIKMLIEKPSLFRKIFSSDMGQSRLAFLFPNCDTDIITFGLFTEDQGYLFSNQTYKNSNIRNVGGTSVSHQTNLNLLANYGSEEYATSRHDRTFSRVRNKPLKVVNNNSDDIKIPAAFTTGRTRICSGYTNYTLYMGLYIPDEYNTDQRSELMIEPNYLNYNSLRLLAIDGNIKYNVKKSDMYQIDAMLRNNKNSYVSLSQVWFNRPDKIFVPNEMIPYLFKSMSRLDSISEGLFDEYFMMVKKNVPSKNKIKKLAGILKRSKDYCTIKGTGVIKSLVVKWYIYNACKHLYSSDRFLNEYKNWVGERELDYSVN